MKPQFSTLYAKIAFVFLVLLVTVGAVQVLITLRSSAGVYEEAEYRLHRPLASNISPAFAPFLADTIDYAGIEHEMMYINMVNPRIEIYLLDHRGAIVANFSDVDAELKRDRVAMEPIRQFLNEDASQPVFGEDPLSESARKMISVTPINIGAPDAGYLYVILRGQTYDSILSLVRGSIFTRTALELLVVTTVSTALLGLLAFAYLTRKFRFVAERVKKFEEGDYSQRFNVTSSDEIAQLAISFNQMADRIESHMAEIREKDQLRRELIANISHDLRSPLASIMGFLETVLMKDADLDETERRRFLEKIFKNARQLNTLVSDLLELSRLDAREKGPVVERFSLSELVHDVLLKFKPQAEARNIDLKSDLAGDVPPFNGDIAMIERALTNLIGNALTYTPGGGAVSATLRLSDSKVVLEISDTGVGIPEADIPRIFERFYRVEKSRTRSSSNGYGLGLAITRRIIEAHHGRITVSSEVNKGSTFRIELPLDLALVASV